MRDLTAEGRKIVFRADSSTWIGSGHVIRCLALADELAGRDYECHFICREEPGHLGDLIEGRRHHLHLLPSDPAKVGLSGARSADDSQNVQSMEPYAAATIKLLTDLAPVWLIVDHYALDHSFEKLAAECVPQLMVIDDLANRTHFCHVLLDQAFGRTPSDYADFVPPGCELLCGASYALLRADFVELRDRSLARRRNRLQRLLVSMGGSDTNNVTAVVLNVLETLSLPEACRVTVVMGPQAPWRQDVQRVAARCNFQTEVLTGVEDMAQIMATSDLAIGAGGITAWERCCLGVPAIIVVTADNQRSAAKALQAAGAALVLELEPDLPRLLGKAVEQMMSAPARFAISEHAAAVTDGRGAGRVADVLTQGSRSGRMQVSSRVGSSGR